MGKYIDAEQLLNELSRYRFLDYPCDTLEENIGFYYALDQIEHYISLLQQQHSSSSTIVEAAKQIAYDVCKQLPNGEQKDTVVYYAILAAIAGAKWMTEQGVTVKGFQYGGNLGIPDAIPQEFYTDKLEEVIVQIRKKEE